MADSTHSLLLFSLICIFAIGAQARPCKTLFISYTVSSSKPTVQFTEPTDQSPGRLFVFTELDEFDPKEHARFFRSDLLRPQFSRPSLQFDEKPQVSMEDQTLGFGSFRDRTKDIISVVVALLFGVGCGALTSAVMYLVWSLVTNSSSSYAKECGEEEVEAGYVKIPTTHVKEGYEGN